MPLFFWLLATTVINDYILGHELYGKHWGYKKHLRWKRHEHLTLELVNKGFYELNPRHAQEQEGYPNSSFLATRASSIGTTPSGNTKKSRQHGYLSKYYELPLC